MSESATQLLDELLRRGVELRVRGDLLEFRPSTAIPPQMRARMKSHKPELLRLVAERSTRFRAGLDYGMVPAGWTPTGWARGLRRIADHCDSYRPDIGHYYRAWAADIDRRLRFSSNGDIGHGS